MPDASSNGLALIVQLAERSLDLVSAASISVESQGERVTAAASDQIATDLDQLQYGEDQGPCIDAMTTGEEVESFPLDEKRWQKFVPAALASGVNGMYSLPLQIDGRTIGAMNLYSNSGDSPPESERQLARMFAQQTADVLANTVAYADAVTLSEQLKEALESREVIGQAKGILMLRNGYGPDEAFDELRKISQDSNVKLRAVAQSLVDSVRSRLR